MSKEFWNERYSEKEYAYGIEANQFIRQELSKLQPGKILSPAEGEGRNALYAAKLGFDVYAFDPSIEGRRKALQLAAENKVNINYQLAGYGNCQYPENSFDVLVLVFAHMPAEMRNPIHQKLITFLKPGGTLILESFSKEQINYSSGGPKDISMLFSEEELKYDFKDLTSLSVVTQTIHLSEGQFHNGKASLVRLTGIK